MSPGVNVQRIEVLKEANQSLSKFGEAISAQLASNQKEINKTLDWLAERERNWRTKVQICINNLDRAKRSYAACLAQPADDQGRRSSCRNEADAVTAAQQELDKAQDELQKVINWRSKVNNNLSAYIEQATRLQRIANDTLGKASAFLNQKARELGEYESINPPGIISALGGHRSAYTRARKEMLLHALDDPLVGRDIKGWIRNELRRVQNVNRAAADPQWRNSMRVSNTGIRMPPGYDAGHRVHSVDHWSNLRFEDMWINRSRYHRATRLGIEDRVR